MTIHSFDEVLRAPTRIHSVQLTPAGKKLPLWRTITWMGLLYFCIAEFVFVIAARLPVTGVLSELFAPLVYYGAFPIGAVWLLSTVELDGRIPHQWVISYLDYLRRPKRVLAGRAVAAADTRITYAGRVRIWWDLAAPRLHHGWVIGGRISTPLSVRFTHAILHRHQVLVVDERHGSPVDHEVQGKLAIRP